jgi:cytochrome b
MPTDLAAHRVRVWDLPTRAFHWLLVAVVVGLVTTAKIGGEAMVWHARLAYCVGALLLFRIVWGFAGGHWSRFGRFLYGPGAVVRYLRGAGPASDQVGHSPLGALSVFAMLLVLMVQLGTGLFSENEELFGGPLSSFVSSGKVRAFTRYHRMVGELLLYALVALHVLAILYYRLRRGIDLLGPMWHGDKLLDQPAPPSRDDARTRLGAAVAFALCAALVSWLASLGGG